MDGLDTLPDENAAAGQHRDEFACAGIQSEASDDDHRRQTADRGNTGVIRLILCAEIPRLRLM